MAGITTGRQAALVEASAIACSEGTSSVLVVLVVLVMVVAAGRR